MKIKLTAVLLCVALLLTLSFNVSANTLTDTSQSVTDTQTTPVTDEITVSVGENGEISVGNLSESGGVSRAQTSGIVSGGIYRIKNVASGKYMNVHSGIDANGTNVYQYTGNDSTEQNFRVVYSSSTDSYMIYAMCSSNGTNRVLDVTRGSNPLIRTQNIKLYSPTDPISQEIKINSLGSNKYSLVMRNNESLALTTYGTENGSAAGTAETSDGNIFIENYTGTANQQWMLELVENPNASSTPIGYLDSVSSTQIGGWAYQPNIPNTVLTVHIYIINHSTAEQEIIGVYANGYRQDLFDSGYGDGYHAFHYAINWKTYLPGDYTVRAYAIGVNSDNVELTNSPRYFTVRNIQGNVEYLNNTGIGGWVWKPDAPNEAIDVHIYITKTNGTQVAVYSLNAWQPRADLAAAGYGDGEHGFSQAIDWASLPEEKLYVVVYAVDGSGYNPSFYSGYYDNRMPIYLIGMVDEQGVDFSTWATQEVVNYAYNIGTPSVCVCDSITAQGIIDKVQESSFATISTHGGQYFIKYCVNPNTANVSRGELNRRDLLALRSDYFSNTRCLFLNACLTASTEDGAGNNLAKEFHNKGVQTVVAFEKAVSFRAHDGVVDNNIGSERWAKIFVQELGNGAIVSAAVNTAIDDAITSFEDITELDEVKRRADALEIAEEWGLVDVAVIGNGEQVIKH